MIMRRLLASVLMVILGLSIAGCVIEEPGGWHHHHHHHRYYGY
jgi:hypothetical protein